MHALGQEVIGGRRDRSEMWPRDKVLVVRRPWAPSRWLPFGLQEDVMILTLMYLPIQGVQAKTGNSAGKLEPKGLHAAGCGKSAVKGQGQRGLRYSAAWCARPAARSTEGQPRFLGPHSQPVSVGHDAGTSQDSRARGAPVSLTLAEPTRGFCPLSSRL